MSSEEIKDYQGPSHLRILTNHNNIEQEKLGVVADGLSKAMYSISTS